MDKELGNHLHHHAPNTHTHSEADHGCLNIYEAVESEWDEERRIFRKVLKTFGTYADHAKAKLRRTTDFLESLSIEHQALLGDYKDHLLSLDTLIDINQNFFLLILNSVGDVYENQHEIYGCMNGTEHRAPLEPTSSDYEKLQSIMKQLYRDWSPEGFVERLASYKPIIDEIENEFGNVESKGDVKILIPGAGTGRLPHEIVRRGYTTQGNEFSMYMLFASNFILNKCSEKGLFTCYPWLHETINVLHHTHQTRPMSFPDIDPSDLPPDTKFSMTAGDFLEVYASADNQSAWNCIATVFFIDCATNIVALVERIHGCLKEGGIWINLGPLLYHYADLPEEKSIEPSYDFLMPIIKKIGFKLEKEALEIPTPFAGNPHSMLSYSYKSAFFVCRKTSSILHQIPSHVENFSLQTPLESSSAQGQVIDETPTNGNYIC